ncbi:hypothetical protein FHS92_002922 [Sphingobium subterraneum]|uniref:Uncharacterized protein n=1 Tax=Sphingobium subterraneum TaxID=627688 RepID=A0A841J9I4_9SPHN|nr:hypothetical protein [Sphingobium subterraneum]
MAVPALAETLKKPPVELDPAKAYVLVEIGKLDDALMYGSLVLGRYDAVKGDIADPTPPPGGKIPRGGWKQDNRVYLLKPAVKAGDHNLFIAELDPGLWVIEGANDTAFALGSSTLQLAAGSVTDIGVVSVYSDFSQGEKRDVATTGRLLKGALLGGLFVSRLPPPTPKAIDVRPRGANDIPLPTIFGAVARPVEWAQEVRFGNHLGGLVNRMGGRKARFRAMAAEQAAEPTPKTDSASEKESGAVSPAAN